MIEMRSGAKTKLFAFGMKMMSEVFQEGSIVLSKK